MEAQCAQPLFGGAEARGLGLRQIFQLGFRLQPILNFQPGLSSALQIKLVRALPDLFFGGRSRRGQLGATALMFFGER